MLLLLFNHGSHCGPPVFHTLKVTLTKGMPGKVTVSSQQSLTSPQCTKRWLLLSPNPSEVPADSPGNCTQGTKAKRDRRHLKAAAKGSLKWVPTERGSAEPRGTHIKCSCTQDFTAPFLQEGFPSSVGTKALLSP